MTPFALTDDQLATLQDVFATAIDDAWYQEGQSQSNEEADCAISRAGEYQDLLNNIEEQLK